ncbi:uncharacterized protein amer3 [Stegostoma tigrinum]|uniref:uncharacterized protein amer3 n=1 Tax=Stegostoma tigrinum TaxID=3053191 RepID=UPI0028708B50|nr:uncharacterized protein amer3 [Stegostoma tigrinum]XP_048398471.2 uncharacterized protein amer3 [Stegostoma tigrinum]XP_048398472.2 uncharacterized protein amer3 [Stegostoma tigrinum]XP_048398473.2 uncharacterized protein amer3 [Stegostoma tigrinum]XP_048398474.2 uncharacterized protein amer3 [Stegostoma tigrinum]XP_048398475.2 uncharacterized protein amer3 [Stegostoma tigrinum]
MEPRRSKNFRKYSLQQAVRNAETFIDIDFERRSLNKYSVMTGGSCKDEKVKKVFLKSGQARSIASTSVQREKEEDQQGFWNMQRTVRKSKTHDCVVSMAQDTEYTQLDKPQDNKIMTCPDKNKDRIVNTINFSKMAMSSEPFVLNRLRERRATSQSNHSKLELPSPSSQSLPSIANCITNRRLSLRKPKRGLRGLFTMRRNRQEKVTSMGTKVHKAESKFFGGRMTLRPHKGIYKSSKILTHAGDSLAQYFTDSDPPSDSSHECSSTLCEDVASLKSFDSLTGCGEIFADEENADQLDSGHSYKHATERCEDKQTPSNGSFQGGGEQLASPGQTDGLELNRFWKNIDNSEAAPQIIQEPPTNEEQAHSAVLKAGEEPLILSPLELQKITEKEEVEEAEKHLDASVDLGTPQSDHQESTSTSDEGYYDSFSPGQEEDENKIAQSPCVGRQFPRDSYSGDALYELFSDPEEPRISPNLDEDASTLQHALAPPQTPLSMYSFYIGAEENMAPSPTADVNCHEFFQGSWKGKECLLKLCDTELSLAMGLVNWLRQKTETNVFGINVQNKTESHCPLRTDRTSSAKVSVGYSVSCTDTEAAIEGNSTNPCKASAMRQNGISEPRINLHDQPGICPRVKSNNDDVSLSTDLMSQHDDPMFSQSNRNSTGKVAPGTLLKKQALLTTQPHRELKNMTAATGETTASKPQIVVEVSKTSLCPNCRKSMDSNLAEVILCSSCFALVSTHNTSELLDKLSKKDSHLGSNKDFWNNSNNSGPLEADVYVSQLLEDCVSHMASLKVNSQDAGQFYDEAARGDCPLFLALQVDQQNEQSKNVRLTGTKFTGNNDGRGKETNDVLNNSARIICKKTKEEISLPNPGLIGIESSCKIRKMLPSITGDQSWSVNSKVKEKSMLSKERQCNNATVSEKESTWTFCLDACNHSDELQHEIIPGGTAALACPKRNHHNTSLSENAYTPQHSYLPLSKSVCSGLQSYSCQVENSEGCKKSLSHQGDLCFASFSSSPSLASPSRQKLFVMQTKCGFTPAQENCNHKEEGKSLEKGKISMNLQASHTTNMGSDRTSTHH